MQQAPLAGTLRRLTEQGRGWIWAAGLLGLLQGSALIFAPLGAAADFSTLYAIAGPVMVLSAIATLLKRRFAPVALLLAFVASRIGFWIFTGTLRGLIPALIAAFIYFRAIEGVRAWHEWAREFGRTGRVPPNGAA